MENELDVIESLTTIGYDGICVRNDTLTDALNAGIKSEVFREIVAWIAYELHVLRKTDEKVDKDSEVNEFSMELSSMLKELGCPYKRFIGGPLSSRFQSKQSRIQLLEYLITELMTAKMCLKQKPLTDESYVIPKFETNTARALQTLARDLEIGKPPDTIAPKALFDKFNYKLEEAKRRTDKSLLGDSLMNTNKQLNEQQWKKLDEIHKSLDEEYNLRRQVLLTRLEVTVQSFQWSDRMKGQEASITNKYQEKMKELDKYRFGGMDTDIVALLAARSDLAIIEKTSSANVRKNTGSKIQKHVIGSVPDRGGRANEHAPPPPEMPSWQTQRSAGGGGGRGGFGGGGGGGGGGFRGGRGGPRGGGGGGRGGGGGGGGNNWQQQPQQFQGGQNSGGRGGNYQNQGGNFQQQNHGGGNYQGQNQGGNNYQGQNQGGNNYQGQNQGGNNNQGRGGDNWLSGSGRVQGAGWNPSQQNNYNNENQSRRGSFTGRGDSNSNQFDDQFQNSRRGGNSNYNRGRSNYNRGGGGGGGGGYRNN